MYSMRASTKKKIKKLMRDPKLFFYDYFSKRINKSDAELVLINNSLPIESKSVIVAEDVLSKSFTKDIKDNHKNNNIVRMKNNLLDLGWLFDELVQCLLKRTCFIQTIPSPNANSLRIAIKAGDIAYILNRINEFSCGDFHIFSEEKKIENDRKSLIYFYFYDSSYIYTSTVVEIDPWYYRNHRIYTHNNNDYVTHIDDRFIHKTMYSPNPYFLQGEKSNVSMIDMLGIIPSVYSTVDFPVDVVYTWVDGSDPVWRKKKKNEYKNISGNSEDSSSARFDQIDEIRYSLRSIAAYFKEVNKIYLVTDQQVPWWLASEDSRIVVVDHKDIFTCNDDLPTFNSHAIEANLHRIPGLSEHFIYMNDDVFMWRPMRKCDFFTPNGMSISRFEKIKNVHGVVSKEFPAWKNAALNVNELLQEKFSKKSYSFHEHCPHSLRKSVLQSMWDDFGDDMKKTTSSKFRSIEDVSPVSFFYHAYAYTSAKSIKLDSSKCITLNSANLSHLEKLSALAILENIDSVCINDGGDKRMKKQVLDALNKKFPIAANWEAK